MRVSQRCKYAFAIMVFALQSSARGEPLGRLFFSPAERAELDAYRKAPKVAAPLPPTAPPLVRAAPESKKAPQSVIVAAPRMDRRNEAQQRRQVLTGFVERSSGANTVWMNNQAEHLQGGYGELDPLDVGKARRK